MLLLFLFRAEDGIRVFHVTGVQTCALPIFVEEGADMLDIGGESTRPQGATPVDVGEELARVLPVVRALHERVPEVPISVDTVKKIGRASCRQGVSVDAGNGYDELNDLCDIE